jgi:hypothetical protein
MRELLPFKHLVETVAMIIGILLDYPTKFKTTVWEDNTGALTLANMEPGQITPQSKFYAINMHWFRSKLKPNKIVVMKIESDQQKADIFTKGLQVIKFTPNGHLLCGW